jgi:hypothetical protein
MGGQDQERGTPGKEGRRRCRIQFDSSATHRKAAARERHCPTELRKPSAVARCDCSGLLPAVQEMMSGMLMYPAQTTQMQPKYRAEYWDWVMCEAYRITVSGAHDHDQ